MNCLSDSYMVHVEGTACLKEMTSNCLISKIHPSVWSKVVEVILGVMERFRYHYKIQNNILLMLCNDRILLVCISFFIKLFLFLFNLINGSYILFLPFCKFVLTILHLGNVYWFLKKYFT